MVSLGANAALGWGSGTLGNGIKGTQRCRLSMYFPMEALAVLFSWAAVFTGGPCSLGRSCGPHPCLEGCLLDFGTDLG